MRSATRLTIGTDYDDEDEDDSDDDEVSAYLHRADDDDDAGRGRRHPNKNKNFYPTPPPISTQFQPLNFNLYFYPISTSISTQFLPLNYKHTVHALSAKITCISGLTVVQSAPMTDHQPTDDQTFELITKQIRPDSDRPAKLGFSKQRDGFSRNDVVNAFQDAFRMIGGVQRMALWANANPDKFYPLYTKLLPSTAIQIGDNAQVVIQHAIPPGPLDDHPE